MGNINAMERVTVTLSQKVYDEILDVLTTREDYLTTCHAGKVDRVTRLDELKVVRAIINTLKEGENA